MELQRLEQINVDLTGGTAYREIMTWILIEITKLQGAGIDSHLANQLREFNKTYLPNGVPEGPDTRQEEFDKFDKDEFEDYIEEMDNKFWEVSDELENALLKHINNSGIGK